jgi:hypothetical protein
MMDKEAACRVALVSREQRHQPSTQALRDPISERRQCGRISLERQFPRPQLADDPIVDAEGRRHGRGDGCHARPPTTTPAAAWINANSDAGR